MDFKKKRSITKGLRNRFSRHNHDTSHLPPITTSSSSSSVSSADVIDSGKSTKPTTEVVMSWTKSFDNLLHDPTGLDLFKQFVKSEFSEENIQFWIACEKYKTCPALKMSSRAKKIFDEFIGPSAKNEINIDSKTRESVTLSIDKPDNKTFELAQHRIQALMAKDSYLRFLASDIFSKWLAVNKITLCKEK